MRTLRQPGAANSTPRAAIRWPATPVDVSVGSVLVEQALNPLKADYPFLDLLQPQGELTALLLGALEPERMNWDVTKQVFHAYYLAQQNKTGRPPELTTNVSAKGVPPSVDAELEALFDDDYTSLARLPSETKVGLTSKGLGLISLKLSGGLKAAIDAETKVSGFRVRRLLAAFKRIVRR